jgi:hypothetical protein
MVSAELHDYASRLHERWVGPDRGITFATNGDGGLCIRFIEAVTGIDPFRLIRHPGLTVTVADLDGLERLLAG